MKKEKIKSALLWWSDAVIFAVIVLPIAYYGLIYIFIGGFMLGAETKWFMDLHFIFKMMLWIPFSVLYAYLFCGAPVQISFYLQKKAREKLSKLF